MSKAKQKSVTPTKLKQEVRLLTGECLGIGRVVAVVDATEARPTTMLRVLWPGLRLEWHQADELEVTR